MATLIFYILSIFPFQAITGGTGKWLQESPRFSYNVLSPEISIYAGGWFIKNSKRAGDFLLMLESGYDWGKKKNWSGYLPSKLTSPEYLFTDFYVGFDLMREYKSDRFSILYGGGISWHYLEEKVWYFGWMGRNYQRFSTGKIGLSAGSGLLIPMSEIYGTFILFRYTYVASWENFDPSRFQGYIGFYLDLRE